MKELLEILKSDAITPLEVVDIIGRVRQSMYEMRSNMSLAIRFVIEDDVKGVNENACLIDQQLNEVLQTLLDSYYVLSKIRMKPIKFES